MPDLTSFNSLPILQVFAGALVLLGSIWMMVQAQRDKAKVPSPAPMDQGVQMFFNGPLIQALQSLRDVNTSLRDVVHGQNNMLQVLSMMVEGDRKVRDELAKQTQIQAEVTRDQTERHTTLMRDLQERAEDILRELKNRNRS
jgi:hypothetical protein